MDPVVMSDDENFEDAYDCLTEKSSNSATDRCKVEVSDNLATANASDEHEHSEEDTENCDSHVDDNVSDKQAKDIIDEAALKEQEAHLSDDEKQARRAEAYRLKDLGNAQYNDGYYESAVEFYTDALAVCLLSHANDRAILYANRAAAKVKLDDKENAIFDCTKALEYNPDHMKARLRRAELYEKTDKLDEALEDYTKAVERDPSLHIARAACMRLPEQIKVRNEKMKDEMLGKLKDLGNMVLRPFGLSTDNFKLQQDPATGSYSVSFQQKAPDPN